MGGQAWHGGAQENPEHEEHPRAEQLYGGPPQGHSQVILPHRHKHSPHLLLWGQKCLIYLKEARCWQLGRGVSLPFDL